MTREDHCRLFAEAVIDLDGALLSIDVTTSMEGLPMVDVCLDGRSVALDADKAQQVGMQLIAAALVLRHRQKEGG